MNGVLVGECRFTRPGINFSQAFRIAENKKHRSFGTVSWWGRWIYPSGYKLLIHLLHSRKQKAPFVRNGVLVGEGGFEPPKQSQQIYSLSPLATREFPHIHGAGGRTRTPDLLITNQLLYQLSYTGTRTIYIITKKNLFVNTLLRFFSPDGCFFSKDVL